MKNQKNNQASPYTISWAILTAVKGQATKRDLNIVNKSMITGANYKFEEGKVFLAHGKDKATILKRLSEISGLNKGYKVTIITDKQFGSIKWNTNPITVATAKQLSETFLVK